MRVTSRIRCTSCKVEVYEAVESIYLGKYIQSQDFKGVNGYPDPNPGDKVACPSCGDVKGLYEGLEKAYNILD